MYLSIHHASCSLSGKYFSSSSTSLFSSNQQNASSSDRGIIPRPSHLPLPHARLYFESAPPMPARQNAPFFVRKRDSRQYAKSLSLSRLSALANSSAVCVL